MLARVRCSATCGTLARMSMNDILERLLNERACTTTEQQEIFLNPDYVRDSYSANLFIDMDRATARIFRALETGERVAIYADFDCDGIPAAVVMHDFFVKIGCTNFRVYIPHRDTEGFGVHIGAIDSLKADGVTLVITVDVGSSAHEQIAHAQNIGIDVIVTDHHEFEHDVEERDVLPPAYAIINPKRKTDETGTHRYPFPDLCGSGVAFKFVCALLEEGKKRAEKSSEELYKKFADIQTGWEKWLLDMMGLATIADMVPLVGENRMLAKFGLVVLAKSRRPGLLALCKVAKIDQRYIDEQTIGYTIAPRINAASRMGNPMLAFELFSTTDPVRAQALAEELEKLNNERRGLVGSIAKAAHAKMEERYGSFIEAKLLLFPPVIVLGDPEWRPAVLGSVASTLAEKYQRPFFLWGREGTGLLKGSCRSFGGVDILAIMTHASEHLLHHGGHKMAGGFAVSDINVLNLQEVFLKSFESVRASGAVVGTTSDVPQPLIVSVSDISLSFIKNLRQLAPFGVGNPEPLVRVCGVAVSVSQFGKEKNHFEMLVADAKNPKVQARAMAFFSTPASFTHAPNIGDTVCVTGSLSESRFAGRVRAELRVEDIVNM